MRWTQCRWLDVTTSKGVMNRQDAELCCCLYSSNITFAAQKLCGAFCCTVGQECISGGSRTHVTTTLLPPAPGCSEGSWHWLEILPGAMIGSYLINLLRVGGVFDCRYACNAFQLVPCQRSSSLYVLMYAGHRRWRNPETLERQFAVFFYSRLLLCWLWMWSFLVVDFGSCVY